MNRRSFLTLAGLGAAGMVLDPERLLWVPGQKTYVFMQGTTVKAMPLSELIAMVYDRVLKEHQKNGQMFWNHDRAMTRRFAGEAVLLKT